MTSTAWNYKAALTAIPAKDHTPLLGDILGNDFSDEKCLGQARRSIAFDAAQPQQ